VWDLSTPSPTISYVIYEVYMSAGICSDAPGMSLNTDSWKNHEAVSNNCDASACIQDLDPKDASSGGSRDTEVKTTAANGGDVLCGLLQNDGPTKEIFPAQTNQYACRCGRGQPST
jgi:hypothetical protein